ncbi:unnamed protein product [Protopolystoma xenopodis]|uniref:Uncharacterized protein n=1 Tax=Protopolystoma xenopodis TaxID=117903 RepID=A0A3S5BTP1_9PLAT|nr:unnamed protein product [Protopolystoma xenopodis]
MSTLNPHKPFKVNYFGQNKQGSDIKHSRDFYTRRHSLKLRTEIDPYYQIVRDIGLCSDSEFKDHYLSPQVLDSEDMDETDDDIDEEREDKDQKSTIEDEQEEIDNLYRQRTSLTDRVGAVKSLKKEITSSQSGRGSISNQPVVSEANNEAIRSPNTSTRRNKKAPLLRILHLGTRIRHSKKYQDSVASDKSATSLQRPEGNLQVDTALQNTKAGGVGDRRGAFMRQHSYGNTQIGQIYQQNQFMASGTIETGEEASKNKGSQALDMISIRTDSIASGVLEDFKGKADEWEIDRAIRDKDHSRSLSPSSKWQLHKIKKKPLQSSQGHSGQKASPNMSNLSEYFVLKNDELNDITLKHRSGRQEPPSRQDQLSSSQSMQRTHFLQPSSSRQTQDLIPDPVSVQGPTEKKPKQTISVLRQKRVSPDQHSQILNRSRPRRVGRNASDDIGSSKVPSDTSLITVVMLEGNDKMPTLIRSRSIHDPTSAQSESDIDPDFNVNQTEKPQIILSDPISKRSHNSSAAKPLCESLFPLLTSYFPALFVIKFWGKRGYFTNFKLSKLLMSLKIS